MAVSFDEAFEMFLEEQKRNASPIRLERLQKELIGERKMLKELIWPVFRTFDGFTLEYEIKTKSGVSLFIDVFYEPLGFAFESEGFVPHAGNISRERFSFERMRVRTIVKYKYKYIPFSWDELNNRPEACRSELYELLGKFTSADDRAIRDLTVYEREVLRYALRINRPFRLADVCYCLGKSESTCRRVLIGLKEKRLIVPVGKGQEKIRLYRLTPAVADFML